MGVTVSCVLFCTDDESQTGFSAEHIGKGGTIVRLIVGLGNPGPEYEHTRHNIGFQVIDRLSDRYRIVLGKQKFNARFGKGVINGESVLLAKPMTYMNASGEAVGALIRFYKIPADCLLVICDDLDLPTGKIRLRQKGSAGGHNGLKSIIRHLGTDCFDRIKIGIGHPPGAHDEVVNYVLSRFPEEERPLIDDAVHRGAEAAAAASSMPFQLVMNRYNANTGKKIRE